MPEVKMAIQPSSDSDLCRVDPVHQSQSEFGIPEHVRLSHSPDGTAVLDIVQGKMFRLNFVGSRVLALYRQRLTEPEIAELLSREFEIDSARLEADVREFIHTLKKHHLLTADNA